MTIMATHFALVLGAWRLRIRIDIDEPREAELREHDAPQPSQNSSAPYPQLAARGRG